MKPVLETERLILRPLTTADAEGEFVCRNVWVLISKMLILIIMELKFIEKVEQNPLFTSAMKSEMHFWITWMKEN